MDDKLFEIEDVKLIRYNGDEAEAVIPAGVLNICAGAFRDKTRLTRVVFPEGLLCISDNAFAGCTALTDVTLPDTVRWLFDGAFAGCVSLRRVVLSRDLTRFKGDVFRDCAALEELVIGEKLDAFPHEAASGHMPSHRAYAVDAGNVYLTCREGLLYDHTGTILVSVPRGITELIVPEGTEGIASYAGYEMAGLRRIYLPDSVMMVERHAFYCCAGEVEVSIPTGCTYDMAERTWLTRYDDFGNESEDEGEWIDLKGSFPAGWHVVVRDK